MDKIVCLKLDHLFPTSKMDDFADITNDQVVIVSNGKWFHIWRNKLEENVSK